MHYLKISTTGPYHINSPWIPHDVESWPLTKTSKEKNFHWSKFNDNLKESKLQGDGLLQINHFCNSIGTALTSTMACNKGIEDYTSLDASTSIKALLIPPTAHSDFHLCNPAYSQLSRILRDHLLKRNTISSLLNPTSFNTLTRYKIEDDGFKIV